MTLRLLPLLALLLVPLHGKPLDPTGHAEPLRIACVGDSITAGSGASKGHSYPDQLQALLGEHWIVRNFGVGGRTLLRKGDRPYWNEQAFRDAQAFEPDAVVLMLGTNDTKPGNWQHKDEFEGDYRDLVEVFRMLPSQPRVFVCRPIPVVKGGNWGINEPVLQEIIGVVDRIAADLKLDLLDLHAPLEGKDELLPDHVHPNNEGAAVMARTVALALRGSTFPLPDPLVMEDATPVTTAARWRDQRRPELLELFGQHVYGRTPIGKPDALRFVLREEKKDARAGKATRLRVGVLFEGREDGRQMELLVYLPNDATGPVPVFLGLNFDGNFTTTDEPDLPLPKHYANGLGGKLPDHRADESMRGNGASRWAYDEILARGYGVATACYGEVEPDVPNQWWHGPRVLAPPTTGDAWGSIGGWAWALSRAMDYLETNPRVDAKRVGVMGFSRLGKTAMWAGAQDERFAAVISQNSGKGGVSLSKRLTGEPVAHLAGDRLGHWFCPDYRQYGDHEAALPVDGHELAALVAPRPLLILSATEDLWSDPEGEFLSGVRATPVYQLLGVEGLASDEWPEPEHLVDSRLGYYLRRGRHNVTAEDWKATLDWADGHLK